MGGVLKKLGSARTKSPRAVVSRGKGKTFKKNPKPFVAAARGVVKNGVPSSKSIFNVGGLPNIPTGNVADLNVSSMEGSKLLRKAGRRSI